MQKIPLYRLGGLLLCSLLFTLCAGTRKQAQQPSDTQSRQNTPSMNRTDPFLASLLEKNKARFGDLLDKKDDYRIQVIYTRIDRKANNRPVFTDYFYNVDADRYFYPASTVKMPTALLALEKLQRIKIQGVDRNTTLITDAAYSGQNPVFNDPTTPDGKPSIAHYVKKIFLVSDNEAFNSLYEFLGQDYINARLHEMGYARADILHRLERSLTEDENRHTNPIRFLDPQGKIIYTQPLQFNQKPYPKRNEQLGKAYYKGGELIDGPMDFSKKNRLVLQDLHSILRAILFPNEVPAAQRFGIAPEDYLFVWKYMSQYPPETRYPPYNSTDNWDAYCKFLYWGAEKGSLPKNFRIFNKVGDAYGFLIDVAYVVDFEKKIEFMVSATIYCNSDGVLNDSRYEYDTIGYPFMKQLGQVLYEYEKGRKREQAPDLSTFRFTYEK